MAHRGDSANAPENTLLAYADAIKLKVDVVETDLRVTKDNEIIFFHDARVDRTTNSKGTVRSLTLNEIKQLDQGYRFRGVEELEGIFPFRGKGLQIQTLEEILTRYPKMKFNMDIKDRFTDAPVVLSKKLKELDAEDRVMIGSFHHRQLRIFRTISGAPTSASPYEILKYRYKVNKWIRKNKGFDYSQENQLKQEDILGKAQPYFALQIPEKFGPMSVFSDKKFVKVGQMMDIAIHVWTINDPGDMFRLLDWGVDGIFSDTPKMLLDIVTFLTSRK
ncbi:MAG TPA: glycerophosphodiester phosphodiesterase [Candidatus Bathyarchaeia archaeon]|nr:glycerophosphodiester phosphodiesterase [Candidatus Bathyarchaeia archaeon]